MEDKLTETKNMLDQLKVAQKLGTSNTVIHREHLPTNTVEVTNKTYSVDYYVHYTAVEPDPVVDFDLRIYEDGKDVTDRLTATFEPDLDEWEYCHYLPRGAYFNVTSGYSAYVSGVGDADDKNARTNSVYVHFIIPENLSQQGSYAGTLGIEVTTKSNLKGTLSIETHTYERHGS